MCRYGWCNERLFCTFESLHQALGKYWWEKIDLKHLNDATISRWLWSIWGKSVPPFPTRSTWKWKAWTWYDPSSLRVNPAGGGKSIKKTSPWLRFQAEGRIFWYSKKEMQIHLWLVWYIYYFCSLLWAIISRIYFGSFNWSWKRLANDNYF